MKFKRLMRAGKFITAMAAIAVSGAGANLVLAPSALADEPTRANTQSQANRLSLFHDYGFSAFGTTSGRIPGQPGGGMLSSMMGGWAANSSRLAGDGGDRAWSISATPLLGYDSNPEARPVSQASFFAGADLSASYSIDLEPNDPQWGGATHFVFGYDLAGALYEGVAEQAHAIQNTVSMDVRHSFLDDTIVVSGRAQNQFTVMQGQSFLNTIDLSPSVEIFWLPQFSTQVVYDWAHLDYMYKVLASQDPDASRHTLGLNLNYFTLPHGQESSPPEAPDRLTEILRKTFRHATIGFAHVWNAADGQSYHFQANRVVFGLVGLSAPSLRDLTFDITYAHEWQNYKNPSTEVPPVLGGAGLLVRRDDGIDIFTVRANARLADLAERRGTLGGFFQWDVISDGSNLKVRTFSEFIVSGGVTYRY